MKRYPFFAVVAMHRADWREELIGLERAEKDARRLAHDATHADRGLLRCILRPVALTAEEVAAIVEQWGREDAAQGEPRAGANTLPEPWRTFYLTGFQGH